MRRQNRSCDQCRKSKRACDASPSLASDTQRGSTVDPYTVGEGDALGGRIGSWTQACSYCLKTNKGCTFQWVQSQVLSRGLASRSGRSIDRQKTLRRRQGRNSGLTAGPLSTGRFDFDPTPLLDLLETSPEDNGPWPLDTVVPDVNISALSGGSFEPLLVEDPIYLPEADIHSIIYSTSQHSQQEYTLNDSHEPSWIPDNETSTAIGSSHSSQHQTGRGSDVSLYSGARKPSPHWSRDSASLSPFSVGQAMMDRSNNDFIAGNLLRIYHDVIEHSLSCWLTEETCPYKIRPWNHNVSPVLSITSQGTPRTEGITPPTLQEWGPVWTNRIYRRVIKLDRVAQATKLIQVTKAEDRAASKALQLAIMAFAAQWAQRSQRAEERYRRPDNVFETTGEANDWGGLAEEFDRSLQRSFWEQARRALQDCADLETFKVVWAEIIFGWTQKPWEDEDVGSGGSVAVPSNDLPGDTSRVRASLLADLDDIISKDGPPVFLERAARKIRALKFKFDAYEAGLGAVGGRPIGSYGGARGTSAMDSEDRGTVGLSYWMAVMADTLSSSMNERPVVLADQDCQHEDSNAVGSDDSMDANGTDVKSQRWGVNVFIQDDPTTPLRSVRWPCSYEDAALAVTRAAPVKVLLFRHVSYLQNALRGRARGQAVEDIIHSAMLIYRYWNVTYGVFFRDLMEDYGSVPARVQAWFFCIHAHWHLAALMLADLIEFVDERGLGTGAASEARATTHMVERMRSASADELSDLSRVSTPAEDGEGSLDWSAPQLPDFHFAVNAGTILTEPWTIIPIRAYAKAYVLHFRKADELWRHDRTVMGRKSESCRGSLRRCEDCIRALWFLGKKSDMARRVADALTQALRALEVCISKDI
ncbi:related to regulatory protein alcR [Cephalotrichum gorgonifer]|uniref:Related to regulatory protein alcR n=1 Tax=Cephalotrichum gorgonifer TaxID=2041049 RepID=A0AAE8SZ59_9PEZI|nr:related to regulatory protein alcR [Cephalotrichum gorgonifer]